MKLDTEFVQLPVKFDANLLVDEVRGFSQGEWSAHPEGFNGNAALRLISAHGADNDDMGGPMKPTPFLERCPYVKQVLAAFQSVFGRSRLMLLDGNSVVPIHPDVNYYWFTRVRIHIPVITFPEVSFHCNGKHVHMGPGEAWIFDSWCNHMVRNPTPHARIHLVADTSGSAAFWEMVSRGYRPFGRNPGGPFEAPFVPYCPGVNVRLHTEKYNLPDVMPPGEVEWLTEDILSDLRSKATDRQDSEATATFVQAVSRFVREWRMVWAQYEREPTGWPLYSALLAELEEDIAEIKSVLLLPSNGISASLALSARVTKVALNVG